MAFQYFQIFSVASVYGFLEIDKNTYAFRNEK